VRADALDTLGNLEPATLAQHAGAVAARLDDSHEPVRSKCLLGPFASTDGRNSQRSKS